MGDYDDNNVKSTKIHIITATKLSWVIYFTLQKFKAWWALKSDYWTW